MAYASAVTLPTAHARMCGPTQVVSPQLVRYVSSVSRQHKTHSGLQLAWGAGVRRGGRKRTQLGVAAEAGAVATVLYTGVALGQGRREDMEDYASVEKADISKGDFIYAGVFDGHAGGKAAEMLSKQLGKELKKTIPNSKDVEKTLIDTFDAFDEKVMDFLEAKGGAQWNCGSTATVALLWKDRLVCANVGDSRAVLSRKGRAMELSSEHRPYGKDKIAQREMKRIKDAGGWISDGRVLGILAVSRAFGDMEFKRGLEKLLVDGVVEGMWTKKFAKTVKFKEPPVVVTPDVLDIALEENDDFVVVASDGLWEVTTSAQAVTFVKRHLDKVGVNEAGLQSAAEALVDDAIKRRRSSDNVSVVVISLPANGNSEPAAVAAPAKREEYVQSDFRRSEDENELPGINPVAALGASAAVLGALYLALS